MKEMEKARIITKRSVVSVMNERKLLSILKHPFLINMHYAFSDKEHLYLVTDLLTGGDLRYHMQQAIKYKKKFTEKETKFIIACIIVGLEYMHENGILHRDIKPENVVLENTGYARLTDLGISKVWTPENKSVTSGTPGYMAPEVMCRQNHGVAVDYYALGVIAYELMLQKRPYEGHSRKQIKEAIFSKQAYISLNDIPDGWSETSAVFINHLI